MRGEHIAKLLALGMLMVLWWGAATPLAAKTAYSDPACTPDAGFFTRMKCLFNLAVDAVRGYLFNGGNEGRQTSADLKNLAVDQIIGHHPYSANAPIPFEFRGLNKDQLLTFSEANVFNSPRFGKVQALPPPASRGFIVEYKEKPILERKKELEEKLLLSPSLSAEGSDGSLSLNQTGEAQLKSQLRDYDQKIEREHEALESAIAIKLSISRSELENKILGEFKNTFNGIALNITAGEADKVRQLPGVKDVHPNLEVKILLNDSVPLIGADKVWKLDKDNRQCAQSGKECLTGKGVKIGIIDTGVDYTHPDLGGCTAQQFLNKQCAKVAGGYDFVSRDSDPMDDQGHGTHVAATAAGNGALKGVAPDAVIYGIKVLSSGGQGWRDWIIGGIEWSVDPNGDKDFSDRLDVINLSLGGWGDPDDPMSQAIDRAVDAGVVAVIAAGNSGPWQGTIGSPGTARKAITVAASDKTDKMAEFSSRGPVVWEDFFERSLSLLKPDVAAPGVSICAAQASQDRIRQILLDWYKIDVRCLDDKHIAISGTSMATPHVAGLAALLKQKNPQFSPEAVKALIKSGSVNIGLTWIDRGAGRINALTSASKNLSVFLFGPEELGGGKVPFSGTVMSRGNVVYTLSYGVGTDPAEWVKFNEGNLSGSGNNILLGELNTPALNKGLYTIKLEALAGNEKAEDRTYFVVDNVRIDVRNYEEFSNASRLIINGNAEREGFARYRLSMESVYRSGYLILKESASQVRSGFLGEVFLGRDELKAGGLWRINLHILDNQDRFLDYDSKIIYIEDSGSLKSGWPRRFDSYGTYSSFNAFDVTGGKDLELFFGNDFYDQPSIKPNFQGLTPSGANLPGWPVGFSTRGGTYSSPAIADINKDGRAEIAILSQANSELSVFDGVGKKLFTYGSAGSWGGLESHPSIADLNKDGYGEIIYPTIVEVDLNAKRARSRINVINHEGRDFPGFPQEFDGWIYGQAVGDMNNDGFPDIVFPASTFKEFIPGSSLAIYILSGRDGALLNRIVLAGASAYAPVLGDVNGDKKLNIVVAVNDYTEQENMGIYVLDANGGVLAGWPQRVVVQGHYYTDIPSIADIDGDGRPEVLFADWLGGVHVWRADGSYLPGWPRYGFGFYQFTQPLVADIDGDGELDIVTQGSHVGSFNSFSEGPNLVFALKLDGSMVSGFPKQTIRRSSRVNGGAPVVADIDNDGLLELVSHSQDDIFCNMKEGNNLFVKAWDLPGKGKPQWPMFMADPQRTGFYGQISEEKPITLLTPNGGERWMLNSGKTIVRWAPEPPGFPTVKAYLEKCNPVEGKCATVGEMLPAGKGSIQWTGEIDRYGNYAEPGDGYYVRVVNTKTGEFDRSDGPFTILPADYMKVDLKVNDSDGPLTLAEGIREVKISWNSANADTCLFDSDIGGRITGLGPAGDKIITLVNKEETWGRHRHLLILCESDLGTRIDSVELRFLKPLDTPRNLQAFLLPVSSTSTAASTFRVGLSWEDTSLAEDGFEIWRGSAPGEEKFYGRVAPNITSFADDEHLGPNETRYYRVRAFQIDDECAVSFWKIRIGCRDSKKYSDFSNEASVITPSVVRKIEGGRDFAIPREGFVSASVRLESGGAAPKLIPKRITDTEIIFEVPPTAPTDYLIDLKKGSGETIQLKQSQLQDVLLKTAAIALSDGEEEGDGGYQGPIYTIPSLPVDYFPKGYGRYTPRKIIVDIDLLKAVHPDKTFEPFFWISIKSPTGKPAGRDLLREGQVGDKKVYVMEWNPLYYGITDPPVGDYSVDLIYSNGSQTLKNVLTLQVPGDSCHLIRGNGRSGNLDLVFVGDQDGYTTVEDFFMEALGELRSLEERGKRGSEDGLATTYSKKINLWVAGLGNLGCVSETSARGGNYATCNEDELHRIAARCPAYDVKVGVGSRGFGGGGISKPNPPLSPKRVVEAIMSLVFGRDSSELIKGDTIFLDGSSSAGLFWHELGHAIGGITDYYRYDPQCKDHPSRMCDSDLPFSNEKASRDKFLMVRELNKSYCNGIIEASQPFPDTINPLSSEPSYRSVKFQVRAKYPTDPRTDPNENTCFATLEVYDTAGKLVRSLTSPEPIEPGRYDEFKNGSRNYVLEWNGRGPDGAVVASGQYFFKIAMRNELTKNSQDGARLRVILVK